MELLLLHTLTKIFSSALGFQVFFICSFASLFIFFRNPHRIFCKKLEYNEKGYSSRQQFFGCLHNFSSNSGQIGCCTKSYSSEPFHVKPFIERCLPRAFLCYAALCCAVWSIVKSMKIEKFYFKNKMPYIVKPMKKDLCRKFMSRPSNTLVCMMNLARILIPIM